jgi:ABC-type sugar transport system substrate-binding protein
MAALQQAIQNKAKEMGVKLVEVDAKNDTNIELANIETLLKKGIDLLLLQGASLKASVASIEAANKAGIPVVHFNIRAEGGKYVSFVGSEQIDSGYLMGKEVVKFYKKKGKEKLNGIYLHGPAGFIVDVWRNDGVKQTLKEAGIADKIVFTEQHADFVRGKAQSITESILTRSRDYDFVIANGDDMILGALGAVKEMRLLDKVILLCSVDGLPEVLDHIKAGEIYSTLFQNPEGQGAGGILVATMHLDGKKNIPKKIMIPFELTTKGNVGEIMKISNRVYK